MTARISLKEVEHVARLARLAISGDEAERMRAELDGILDWMKTLEKLDTTGVAPTTHSVPMVAPLRDDRPEPSLRREETLRAAPKTEAGAFAVPKVLEGS
jgi:aspartyl-tRNA(Asn)/glutamyl-tRNA(Gln) amidotransferase subunit C